MLVLCPLELKMEFIISRSFTVQTKIFACLPLKPTCHQFASLIFPSKVKTADDYEKIIFVCFLPFLGIFSADAASLFAFFEDFLSILFF